MATSHKNRKADITARNYSLNEIIFLCLSKWHRFATALVNTKGCRYGYDYHYGNYTYGVTDEKRS